MLGVAALEGRGFAVRSVAWRSDHLEAEVSQPDGERLLFTMQRASGGRPSYLSTERISVYYGGASLDSRLDATIRAVLPKALARLSIEDLARLFTLDPDAGNPTEPLPAAPAEEQADYEQQALLATWGSPGVWSSFFAVAEVARSQLDSLDFFDRCTFLQHCDQECLAVNPQLGVPAIPVVLYPWEDRVRRLDWPGQWERRAEASRRRGPGMVTTDLDEQDVILGRGPQKLAAALDYLAEQKELGDLVFCSTTCVPVVSGEDMESVIESRRDKLPVPLFYLTTTPQSMQGVFRDLLVRRRLEAERWTPPPEAKRVNLIGFPEGPPLEELRTLLRLVGVEVNVVLLPSLSPGLVEALPNAALDVMHPNDLWQGHYDQLRFDSPRPSICPPAPYGFEGTLRWVREVAEALDLAGSDEVLEREVEALRTEWDELRRQASEYSLGFVIRDKDARHLLDPAQSWGIPLLRVTEEMGFDAEILLVVTEPGEIAELSSRLAHNRREPETVHIVPVTSPQELERALSEARSPLFYSEHFFDRRLSEAGKSSFSGQYFEHGLGGAIRSLRRLVELCRLPFFARYGIHLAATASRRHAAPALGGSWSRDTDQES